MVELLKNKKQALKMVKEKINNLVKDHEEQLHLLKKYSNAKKVESSLSTDLYNTLKNALRNHVNTEEDIFNNIDDDNKQLIEMIEISRRQHKEISILLDETFDIITESMLNEKLNEISSIFSDNKELEENMIYPEIIKIMINVDDAEEDSGETEYIPIYR
jgi:hypothetical protein